MSEETQVETVPEESADRLLAVGDEVRKRRGRPPGSKNRAKDDSGKEPKVNETNQRRIFAGALIALFSILAIFLGWFGYEYHKKLEFADAEEGGTYLLPISQKIGSIAAFAFYLSFPAWMIAQVNMRFRKKVEGPKPGPSPSPGNSVNGAPYSVEPPTGEAGFTAEPEANA